MDLGQIWRGVPMNKEKMKAKCEAWIKEGMGACRAPITYEELNRLLTTLEDQEAIIQNVEQRLYALESM